MAMLKNCLELIIIEDVCMYMAVCFSAPWKHCHCSSVDSCSSRCNAQALHPAPDGLYQRRDCTRWAPSKKVN